MDNLICSGCASKIEDALTKRENITNATFNFTNQTMLLETDENFDEQSEIIEIKKIVDSIESGVDTYLPNRKHKTKRITNMLVHSLLV